MGDAEGRSLAVLTGAGISAESGIATFRGMGGLWEKVPIEEVATPWGFAKDPRRVWGFYEARRRQAAACSPNAGHRALARLEEALGPDRFTLATQNVDGLHALAGSRNLLEIHGSLWRVRCTRCGEEREDRRVPLPELPPHCPACGAMLRPAVVWFGEVLPEGVFGRALAAAESSALFLVVGTSAQVEPAASLARIAARNGAALWEVNPEETPLTPLCHRSWRSEAGAVLEAVAAEALAFLGP
ncbi:MAG: SIR2 family NAD-dependent protein deacylase [Acidobacteriota bacterium]